MQWLRAGTVVVGLGVAITSGQGVAAAAPADSADSGQTTSSSTDNQKKPVRAPTKHRAGSASGSSGKASSSGSSASARQKTKLAKQADRESDAAANSDEGAQNDRTAGKDADTEGSTEPMPEAEAPEVPADTGLSGLSSATEGVTAQTKKSAPAKIRAPQATVQTLEAPAETVAVTKVATTVSVTPDHPILHETTETTSAAPADQAGAVPSAQPVTSVSVAASRAEAANEVTLAGIVTDVLTWIGLGPLANDLPVPPMPVGSFVGALWLVVRETHDRLTTLHPVASSIVAAAALDPEPLDLTDLLARQGVSVSLNENGHVDVIDGGFTDATVTSTADAARVLNGLAALLGESAGFAVPDKITVQRAGSSTPGDISETFYRVVDTVGGLTVVGSEVILVTDGSGTVTGVFNNHDTRVDDMDITLDRRIDVNAEAIFLAAGAYLKANGRPADLFSTLAFIAFSKFDPELVVNAADSATPPQLVWRVAVDPPQPWFAPPRPAATYYLYANGSSAATVMMATSSAQALTPATASAKDVLGQSRTIDVAKQSFFFFQSYKLQDLTRNVATYKTTYAFLGFGPTVPSSPVSKGWFGWNTPAVSAHANIAVVYDYYKTVLGLTSFDGNGGAVTVVVDYNPDSLWAGAYNNAFWDASKKQLVFGNGADLEGALDIVGHEYTHAVVSYILGNGGSVLDSGESGAVNEAFADILGSLIEGKTGTGFSLIGEDSDFAGGAVRNVANPSAIVTAYGPYRDNYATRYTGTDDDGGEHVNSTIFSHAAYTMITDPATSGISAQTWSKVFYHSLYRLSASANFVDARAAVVDTAGEFGFTATQLQAIKQAFDDVGILAPANLIAV